MYNLPEDEEDEGRSFSAKLDFVQLGWLALWVLHPSTNYHEREWKDVPQEFQNDPFILQLVQHGRYVKHDLQRSSTIIDEVPFLTLFTI